MPLPTDPQSTTASLQFCVLLEKLIGVHTDAAEKFSAGLMSKHKGLSGVRDVEVRRLLDRFACPIPFHAVRTRFLGNIASPVMAASPLDQVRALWGGELPEFDSVDAVNELVGALVMGLWNRLTLHQDRKHPFRVIRFEVPETREGLQHLARVRREEVDGFVEGLFGAAESIDLPEKAHRALNILSDLRAILEGVRSVASDENKPATAADLAGTLRHLRELSRIVEDEMHAVMLSCTRARRNMIPGVRSVKPTLH